MLPNPDGWQARGKKKETQNKSETASTGQYFRSTIRVRVSYLRSRIFHWFWKKNKFTQTTIIQQKAAPVGRLSPRESWLGRGQPWGIKAQWAYQALFTHSGTLESHPWCLAWYDACTKCQNNCRLGLECTGNSWLQLWQPLESRAKGYVGWGM